MGGEESGRGEAGERGGRESKAGEKAVGDPAGESGRQQRID